MLIIHGRLVTCGKDNQIIEDGALLVREGMIVEIGLSGDLISRHSGEEMIDAHGQCVLPANICAHTHFYGAFARGMSIPGPAPADFPQILRKLWWGLDRALSLKDIYYSTLVCLIDAVRHGTTTLVDHHASPYAIDGSLDQVALAVLKSGVRASLCYEVTDRDGEDRANAGIIENIRFHNFLGRSPELRGILSSMFGLHASMTLSDRTLDRCVQAAPDDLGFHIHVAEHPSDEYDSLEKSGLRVVDRLEKKGLLGPNSIAVHAVHVDAREVEILARSGTWVTHQPRSNMNNAVGLPLVEDMLRAGVRVCLGNDGFSNAMWEEWKAAYLAHKLVHSDPRRMTGVSVYEMAVINNADLVKMLFDGLRVGALEVGAAADLIFVDYKPFTPFSGGNFPWHVLFGFNESMITTTICNGKILMSNRELLLVDEERVIAETRRMVPEVWDRYQQIVSQ
jgi:putative selenium metabolism protein SsnA